MCSSIKMFRKPFIFNKDELELEESMIEYNPIHFTMVDFDYLHLNNDMNNMKDDYKHICGIIISLIGIYYLIYNSFITFFRK
jgi:hypothetical protein